MRCVWLLLGMNLAQQRDGRSVPSARKRAREPEDMSGFQSLEVRARSAATSGRRATNALPRSAFRLSLNCGGGSAGTQGEQRGDDRERDPAVVGRLLQDVQRVRAGGAKADLR